MAVPIGIGSIFWVAIWIMVMMMHIVVVDVLDVLVGVVVLVVVIESTTRIAMFVLAVFVLHIKAGDVRKRVIR